MYREQKQTKIDTYVNRVKVTPKSKYTEIEKTIHLLTPTEKGILGEDPSYEAYSNKNHKNLVLRNLATDNNRGDIDNLIIDLTSITIDEDKNLNSNTEISLSWFCSHVIDRYVKALPIAQNYAEMLGIDEKNIKFNLTISVFKPSNPLVQEAVKALKINVVETGLQVLKEEDKKQWIDAINRSVKTLSNNTNKSILNSLLKKNNIIVIMSFNDLVIQAINFKSNKFLFEGFNHDFLCEEINNDSISTLS